MTLNNSIDLYFHMRNHYKKLKHVKSVIETFPPKGRSRKEKVAKERNERYEGKNSRARSATRPPTRRHPKDTPDVKSKSLGRNNASVEQKELHLTPSNELIKLNCEQHEYLQFSLRITEDIIKNDLYTNKQMMQVVKSHFEANEGRLEKEKMQKAIMELCKELNIPYHESLTNDENSISNKSEKCICSNSEMKSKISSCECDNERIPPIPCWIHENFQIMGDVVSSQVEQVKYVELSASGEHLSDNDADFLTNSYDQVISKQSDDVELNDSNVEEFLINEIGEDKYLSCNCPPPSCDPSTCDVIKDILKPPIKIPVKTKPYEILSKPTIIPEEIEVFEETKTEIHSEPEPKTDKCCTCTGEDKLKSYEEYFDKKFSHPKNIKQLACSTFTTSINPTNKKDLHSLTYSEKSTLTNLVERETQTRSPCVKNALIQSDLPVEKFISCNFESNFTSETPVYNRNDYIMIDGPIFIPKASVQADTNLENSQLTHDVGTYVAKKKEVIRPKKDCWFARDCDLTPQRDILKATIKSQCHCDVNKNNLLLSDQYLRYKDNLQHFYPTIATQVSSTDLVNYEIGIASKSGPNAATKINYEKEYVKQILDDKERKPLQEKISFNELENPVNDDSSVDSMEKRIQRLRLDMDKYRDGNDELVPITNVPRGVCISEEVELIRNEIASSISDVSHRTTDVSKLPRRGSMARKN